MVTLVVTVSKHLSRPPVVALNDIEMFTMTTISFIADLLVIFSVVRLQDDGTCEHLLTLHIDYCRLTSNPLGNMHRVQ